MEKQYQWIMFIESLTNQLFEYNTKRREMYLHIKEISAHHALINYFTF